MSTASKSDWRNEACSMRLAESTFDTAIIEPTERSMPPLITTIAWAVAAIASGKAPSARDCTSKAPKLRWIASVARIEARNRRGMPATLT